MGFSLQWCLLLQSTGSGALGLSSCGAWPLVAPQHVGSFRTRDQLILVSPALASGFLTTGLPGKSHIDIFKCLSVFLSFVSLACFISLPSVVLFKSLMTEVTRKQNRNWVFRVIMALSPHNTCIYRKRLVWNISLHFGNLGILKVCIPVIYKEYIILQEKCFINCWSGTYP